ncbi:MAG: hypothetical protein GYA02_06350, partial [Clostridiaceae bacterium]|nr:hypothetical protein [Clostridiaceae bacterium]
TRGDSPVSTGFRGINAYVFQGAKNIVLKNFKLINYRGILHTILDLTFKNMDCTKKIISEEIFGNFNYKTGNTSSLDEYGSVFFNVVLNKRSIKDANVNLLLSSLKEIQSESLHNVVVERWNAIQSYYLNEVGKAIEYEKKALDKARELQLPNWLIQDILIDLKNLYFLDDQQKNRMSINNPAQKELDSEKNSLFYPLLDRYSKYLYKEIIDEAEKLLKKSPYSVTYGNNIDKYSNYLSNIYAVSVFNGSLTHLLKTIEHIKNIAFQLCQQYDDWDFRVLLIKMVLVEGNKREIKEISYLFNDVYGKMNDKDARSIYERVSGIPIDYKRKINQLLAFQYLGYYFDDYFYKIVWEEISSIVNDWINDEDRVVLLGDYIFDALIENLMRVDNNSLITNVLIKVFEKRLKRFYDKALKMFSTMDIKKIRKEIIERVTEILTILIKDKEGRSNCRELPFTLIYIRKQTQEELSKGLDEVIKEFMPEFFKNQYLFEIKSNSREDSEAYIKKCVNQINRRNETQGKNGCYVAYGDDPYKTIENIIYISKADLGKDLTEQIIQACTNTLYSGTQLLSEKVKAINLITFMRLASESLFDYDSLVNKLIKDEEKIISDMEDLDFEKTSRLTITFNFAMMKVAFNKIQTEEMLSLFSSYINIKTFEKVEALKTIVSMFEHNKDKQIEEKILLIILHFVLESSHDSNHDVRYFATKAMILLLSSNNKEPVIKRLLSLMDYDSAYIKRLILKNLEKIKPIDMGAYEFIKEKANVDTHFVIRNYADFY